MVNFKDRRAGSPEREAEKAREREAIGAIAPGSTVPAAPVAPSTWSTFFSEKEAYRSVTRGEYMNLRASEEFARRESTWWRRAWRWLTQQPQVRDLNDSMADAHERALLAIAAQRSAVAAGGSTARAQEEQP